MLPGLINPNRNSLPRQNPETNQNLVNNPLPQQRVARPPGFWSGIIVDLIVILLACSSGYLYYLYLIFGGSYLIYATITASVLLMVSLFDTLLTKSFTRRIVVVLAEVFAMSLWFMSAGIMPFTIAVAGATAFFMLWGELQSRREMENGLEIQFFKIARPQLNKGITALILFAVLSYLPVYNYEHIFFTEKMFTSIYNWAAGIVSGIYQEVKLNGTSNEFTNSLAEYAIKSQFDLTTLPDNAKEEFSRQTKEQILKNLKSIINIDFSQDQSMRKTIYVHFKDIVQGWSDKFGLRFLAMWATVVFFLVRSFGFLIYFLVSLISFFVYQLLLATNFIKIVGESRMHETLEYE